MAPGQRDVGKAALSLTGDAGAIAAQLTEALPATHGFDANRYQAWRQQLADKVDSSPLLCVLQTKPTSYLGCHSLPVSLRSADMHIWAQTSLL